ncbi:ferredoxin, 2Fe-2S [Rhodococcus koreensis]|uniref:Ferredoxin, 2Fe-2S n=2 Tax=Rhodococcus koreensis TaxID=99653 RepID=A0A1H4L016_9NOCA|nr:2Fe-2S iron-sulfur cluster-binding protein [Rhodococcus koreensis]SEB64139.1 ferredoxin, 2Fe-2S [Rhodococcus koreensis]
MVNVRFKVNGEVVAAKGEPGDSIMQVAVRQQLPSIEGECGGELSCATCHVYADTQGFRPLSEEEGELLELVEERADNSRLSCQLILREEMTDIEVTIP